MPVQGDSKTTMICLTTVNLAVKPKKHFLNLTTMSEYTFWDEMWNVPPKPEEPETKPEKEKEI